MPDPTAPPPGFAPVANAAPPPPPGFAPVGGSDIPLLGRVSKGMNDHDILTNGLGYSEDKAKEIMSAPGYKPGIFANSVTDPNSVTGELGHTIVGSIYKGLFADPSAALGQITSHISSGLGLTSPKDTELRDALVKLGHANYQQNWKGNTAYNAATGTGSHTSPSDFVGQAIGQAVPYVLTEGKSPTAIAGKVLSREAVPALTSLAAKGAASGLLQPVDNTDSGFTTAKAEQVGTGAIGGLVGGVVGQKLIAPGAAKAVNAFRGQLKPEAQAIASQFEKAGVTPSVGDITQNVGTQRLENLTGYVPGSGMNAFRATQMGQAKNSVTSILADTQKKMADLPWSDLVAVQKAAKNGNKVAQGILNEVNNAGDDWNTVLQASGKLNAFKTKLTKDALYNNVSQIAGDANVPIPGVHSALQKANDQIERTIPNPQLQKLVSDIQDRYFPGRNEAGQTVAAPSDTTFSGLQLLRARLGDMIRGGSPEEQSILMPVKSALEGDMGNFANKSGNEGLAAAQKAADTYYRNTYLPTKAGAIAKAFNNMDPTNQVTADKIFSTLFKPGTTTMEAQRIFANLDPKGQAAVRTGIVSNAADAAMDGDKFSPTKYASYIKKYGDTANVAFKGEDKWAVDGLAKVMGNLSNASKFSAEPPTGQRVLTGAFNGIPFLAAGLHGGVSPEGMGAAGTALLAEGTAGRLTKILLTSKAGRNLLLAASDMPSDSPALAKLAQKALVMLPATTGAAAGARTSQPSMIPVGATP